MKELFGDVVLLSHSKSATSLCGCELEDDNGCVGECYDSCDCYCEQYKTVDPDE